MPVDFGVIEEIGRRGAEEVSVEWKIPNFPSLLHGRDDFYLSPKFSMGVGRWCLGMWLNWEIEAGNPASGWVRLALGRCNGGPDATFRCSAGIRGSGGVEKRRGGEKEFKSFDDYYYWEDFCSRSDLLEHRTRLMPDDILTIRCVLKRPGTARGVSSLPSTQVAPTNRIQPSDKQDACTQTDCNLDANVFTGVKKSTDKRDSSTPTVEEAKEVPTEENQSLEKQGVEKALEDFGTLLASGENSDVTVQVGDVEFKVHSQILLARSPALSVSLRHESKEKASSKIHVEDTDPGAFREYLQYLYTGSVRSLTEQNVFNLHRLADKYLTDNLKLQCLKHVRNTLSVRTFCDAVKLALTHGECDLLERALDFAKENIQSIIVSVEWQNFICEHPREANEILVKCFGPRS